MLEFFQNALNTLNQVPPEAWSIIIEIAISALIVSPFMLGLKKWFKIHGEKLMVLLVAFFSIAASVVAYLIADPYFAPWIILVQGWLTFATTQPVYYLLVKPFFGKLGAWFTDQVAKATQITEAKAAAVPPEGLPVSLHNDFN